MRVYFKTLERIFDPDSKLTKLELSSTLTISIICSRITLFYSQQILIISKAMLFRRKFFAITNSSSGASRN